MNIRKFISSFIIASALVLSVGCATYASAVSAGKGKAIAFRFNPPDGISFTETCKYSGSCDLYGVASKPFFATTTKSRITIKKIDKVDNDDKSIRKSKNDNNDVRYLDETRYVVSKFPLYYKATGDTTQYTMEDVVSDFFDCSVLEYELDKDGYCNRILGLEKLVDTIVDKVRRAMPNARLNPNGIIAVVQDAQDTEIGRWAERFCPLTGRYMNVGETIKMMSPEVMPFTGELIKTNVTVKLVKIAKVNGRELVTVRFNYATNADAMGEWTTRMVNDVVTAMFPSMAKYRNFEVSHMSQFDKEEYVIDTATGLPHSISSKSTYKMVISGPGMQDLSFTYGDYYQYTYDYSTK